jgi:Big-like domain-containing protein
VGKTRFLTRLAAKILVVAVATGGGLLIGGVANAAPPATSSAMNAAVDNGKATATTLIVAPSGSFSAGFPITLVAIVTPRAAAGKVQFKDGNTNIGDPVVAHPGTVVTNIGGHVDANSRTAFTLTSTLPPGPHSLTAVFTPTDPSAYDPSTSPAVSLTVTPPLALGGFPLPIPSILQLVFGGLFRGTVDPSPVPVKLDFPGLFTESVGDPAGPIRW